MVYRITKRNEGREESRAVTPELVEDVNIADRDSFGSNARGNEVRRTKPGINNRMIPSRLLRARDGRFRHFRELDLFVYLIFFRPFLFLRSGLLEGGNRHHPRL